MSSGRVPSGTFSSLPNILGSFLSRLPSAWKMRDLLEIVVTESDCDELEQVSGKRVHPCFGAKLPELSPSR